MCVQRRACRMLPGCIWPVVLRGHPLRLYMDGRPLVPLVISRMLILLVMLWTSPKPLLLQLLVTELLALCASTFLVRVHVHESHTDLLYLLGELIPTMARDQFAPRRKILSILFLGVLAFGIYLCHRGSNLVHHVLDIVVKSTGNCGRFPSGLALLLTGSRGRLFGWCIIRRGPQILDIWFWDFVFHFCFCWSRSWDVSDTYVACDKQVVLKKTKAA